MKLIFHHPEPGLLVTLEADPVHTGHHGAQGAAGLSLGTGHPPGITGPDGYLTRQDGSAYTLPVAGPADPTPPTHRLTVWRAGRAVRVVTFIPQGPGPELDVLRVALDDVSR